MDPEQLSRQNIDRQLESAGWIIQDTKRMNLGTGLGVAVREFKLDTGEADYLLFIDRKAAGSVEAKPEGTTLSGVFDQNKRYVSGLPDGIPCYRKPLPFMYESTGVETCFCDLRDPDPRSRRVFAFHKPETLQAWLGDQDTLRARLLTQPPLISHGLRDCQIEAIKNLELSLRRNKPRALIQMTMGAGKTFTAITEIYRLLAYAKAKRVLFLVDRSNLGKQVEKELQAFRVPDINRLFTELYIVQRMHSNTLDTSAKVCIATIQRLYSMLRGEAEFDETLEEASVFDKAALPERPLDVAYNQAMPIETFDFIVVDECHRSIYKLWRQVLEYFDCFTIGLTATPSKQTLGFFDQNLVSEYSHERAVADGVNVGYEVYRIKTKITEQGSTVEAGNYVDKRDKNTRKIRWEELEEDLPYAPTSLDRDIVSKDQIRTIIKTFRDKITTEIFPGRTDVPKTLIFAKDDSHAEDIVQIIREESGKGNEFCKKITYRTYGEKPEDILQSFRNSYNPRIAVTVDMIATGTDVKPLECLIFMRNVNSATYFEQMKGRGSRVINPSDLRQVTADASAKTHFVIIDCVGVCENPKRSNTISLERKKNVTFDKLLQKVAAGNWDEDNLTSLAGRLARLDRKIEEEDRAELGKVTGGKSLKMIINKLLDAVDGDKQVELARDTFNTKEPTDAQIETATKELAKAACLVFDNADFRNLLSLIQSKSEQVIDNVSKDELLSAGTDVQAKEKAKAIVGTFQQFIEENKDEITALQIIYNMPYSKRHVTFEQVEDLQRALAKPPYMLNTDVLWRAYEQLKGKAVKPRLAHKILTDLISLVKFAIGKQEVLVPFPQTVDERYQTWIKKMETGGKKFTKDQAEWLTMIKDHIAMSLHIGVEDFEYAPFHDHGGAIGADRVFGKELRKIIDELNEVLAA